jgi:hypothetical protein
MELFYQELKRLAAGPLRRAIQGHSRRPTLLVNELCLQLVKVLSPLDTVHASDKAAFFGVAGPDRSPKISVSSLRRSAAAYLITTKPVIFKELKNR